MRARMREPAHPHSLAVWKLPGYAWKAAVSGSDLALNSIPIAKRPTLRRIFLGLAILPIALLACVLTLPMPKAALATVVDWSADWMVSEQDAQASTITRYSKKFVSLLIQNSLAAHLVSDHPIPATTSDIEKITSRVFALKRNSIVQSELMHLIPTGPPILTGLGWCDNINGAAALLLSHDFKRAEIIGVYKKDLGAGHSFGRVWSDQFKDWLYFDVWTDEVVVFTDSDDAPARFLARVRPTPARPDVKEDPTLMKWFHDHASSGFVHNQLQPTLLEYAVARIANFMDHGNTSPRGYKEKLEDIADSRQAFTFEYKYPHQTPASRAYLSGRLNLLFGNDEKAKIDFAKVAEIEAGKVSVFGKAAELFANRLTPQPTDAPITRP